MAAIAHDDRFTEVLQEEGKPRDMCEVLDRVEARGEAKGIQRGIDQNRIESIKNVMKKLKYSAQQAMELLEIPAAEQPKDLAQL